VGVQAFASTVEEARASFLAALICLPLFLLLRIGFPSPGAAGADPLRAMVADLIAYACAWAGFALASLPVVEAMGRRALWPRFIAAWNWVNLVQYAALSVTALPALLGLRGFAADAIGLAGLGYAIWLQWFTARAALGVDALRAAGLVVLDMALSVFLSGVALRMALG